VDRKVLIKNPNNDLITNGIYGFAWTYFLFGWFQALFRGELIVAIIHLIFSILTFGLWKLVFCFLYNRQYTTRLISSGFKFADRPEVNAAAALAVGSELSLASLPAQA
jgi:hypothetical protein